MKPVRHANGEREREPVIRDDTAKERKPPPPEPPPPQPPPPTLTVPQQRPVEEPRPPSFKRVGAFRFGPGQRLQADVTGSGTSSTLATFPQTEPNGTSFVGQQLVGGTHGVRYKYYQGSWNGLLDFTKLTPVKTGSADNFDLSVALRSEDFGIVFESKLEVPADGRYQFFTTSDDGSMLWIGETLVVDNNGLHGAKESSGSITLTRGRHAITVAFFQKKGAASLGVSYEGPDIPKKPIPNEALFRGDPLILDPSEGAILLATPSTFRLWGDPDTGSVSFGASFYEDAFRTFFIEPRHEPTSITSELGTDSAHVWRVESISARGLLGSRRWWRFWPFYHPYTSLLERELHRGGLAGLFQYDVQANPRALIETHAHDWVFHTQYAPTGLVDPDHPADELDFSDDSPYSAYNWELFFHVPLLIAERLSENQRFEEAQKWFHYIFDPTQPREGDSTARSFWRFQGFQSVEQQSLQSLLRLLAGDDAEQRRLTLQVERWRKNPFEPHSLAALRTSAYQLAVVMKYIDNLIAWGDQLFRLDTLESINEATLLYVLASDLLGPRPQLIPRHTDAPPRTFEELGDSNQDDFLIKLENVIDLGRQARGAEDQEILTEPYYFCAPQNEKLLSYWDTVENRLFKIRHCMNLAGVERPLPLSEPPISPELLVRAAAAGVDIASVLAETAVARMPYRFITILQAAKELCGDLKSLAGALLAALEKRDAEELALLRSRQELVMLDAVRAVRQKQVDEARKTLEGLRRSRESAELRYTYYRDIQRMNANEKQQLQNMDTAFTHQQAAQLMSAASSAAHLIPDFTAGGAGGMGSPVATVKYGGAHIGSALQAASGVANFLGAIFSHRASVAGIQGGYDRRWDDWKQQERLAHKEMEQLDQQLLGAEIRVAIAEKELGNHDQQVEHAKEAYTFLRGKFTNRELYDWMVSQLSALYFQAYQLTYDVAKRAQRAYQFELGGSETFVQFGYWDSLKKGLLAGERLHHDLKRMELSWLENHRREHELTRHVSLALLDPVALLMLRNTGECFVELPEALFDSDLPGHYMRRLKLVSLSIPSVTGPYTSVNCTLTLLWNTVRKDAALRNGVYARARGPDGQLLDDDRFVDGMGSIQSIVTSSGREDAGLFEQNLRDERYLPFEGAGAVSRWRIQLPKETNRFDFDTLTDVILHVRYTARDGGEPLRKAAWDTVVGALPRQGARLFLADHEFPDAWYRFLHPQAGGSPTLDVSLDVGHFPYQSPGLALTVRKVELFAQMQANAPATRGKLVAPGGAEHAFEWPAGAEPRLATVELPGKGLPPGAYRLELEAGATPPVRLALVCGYQVNAAS